MQFAPLTQLAPSVGAVRRRIALWTAAVLVLASAGAVAACGGDDEPSNNTGLSNEQTGRMSRILNDNLARQGATFTMLLTQLPANDTVQLVGEIDWVAHTGHATVSATGSETGVTEVYWNDTTVFERRPGLIEKLNRLGGAAPTWVSRPPDLTGRLLDIGLATLTALASESRDNPLLIAQTVGSKFVGTDTVNGVEVEVLQYGTATTYALALDDGRLVRFEADNDAGTRPIRVDLNTFGPQTVVVPVPPDVVDVAAVDDLYEADRAGP
jgi:hypothetical protein